MAYTIWPQQMATVFQRTAGGRDELEGSLAELGRVVADLQGAAASAAPVVAALGELLAAHDRTSRTILDRVASALLNGDLAVEAYVHGDEVMAGAYARASAAALPPGAARAAAPDLANPLPAGRIQGG